MKTVKWMVAAVLCTVGWSGAQAAERTFGDGTLPDFLAVYDVDGDGVLSVEEIQAMKDARRARHDEWLAHWDTNGDGVIDEAERLAAREALRDRIEAGRTNRFNEADTDGDGCLTLAEFSAIPAVVELAKRHPDAPAAIYDRLDANDDDCISVEEFIVHLRHHRIDWRNPETFRKADTNTNGCLTLVEFSAIPAVVKLAEENPEQPAQLFARLDANHDECLSPMEFLAPLPPPPPPEWRTPETFAAADTNHDGCVGPIEFEAIPEVRRMAQMHPDTPRMLFGHLDVDRNHCLSLQEFTAPLPPPPPPGG